MKIIIVGGGLSGLATYLFLKKQLPPPPGKSQHEILILEKYQVPKAGDRDKIGPFTEDDGSIPIPIVGGGLGVAPNGMKHIRALDPEIYDAILAQGYAASRFQMKNSRDMNLGCLNVTSKDDPPVPMVLSSRQGIWDCVNAKVPDSDVRRGVAVSKVEKRDDLPLQVYLDDGSSLDADLVIGADGVNSTVKSAILGDLAPKYPPSYEGIASVGGFMPSSFLPQLDESKLANGSQGHAVFEFGGAGFMGYGPSSSSQESVSQPTKPGATLAVPYGPTSMWWSSFGAKDKAAAKAMNEEQIRAKLLERHGDWSDPVVARVVKECSISGIILTWTTPKLPRWYSEGLVLVGDAAHALPSSSGQGVSQCFEDAHVLSLLLAHHLNKCYTSSPAYSPTDEGTAVLTASKQFQDLRKPRVEAILDGARRMGDNKKGKGVVGEWLMYAFIWAFIKLGVMNMWNRRLFEYDFRADVEKVCAKS